MAQEANTQTNREEPMVVEIRIKGHLDGRWADWFDGLAITPEENGNTLLSGPVVDQAALYGLLKKIRDMGLPLLSFSSSQPGESKTSQVNA
ncbi:MAG: hypothetical protein ACK2U5_17135 [Candidatus Promineifilaceae bacterium]|jgi:hypothetical protein